MFLIECSRCGRRELRGARSIERLENTASGVRLTVRCRGCGDLVILDGRAAPIAGTSSTAC